MQRHTTYRLFSLLLLSGFINILSAQSPEKIDSLQHIVEEAITVEDKVVALHDLASATLLIDNKLSLATAEEALELSLNQKDNTLIANSYETLKHTYLYDNDFDNAVRYIDSAIHYYQLLDDQRNVARMLVSLNDAYNYQGKHDKAYECIVEAINIFQQIEDYSSANYSKILLATTLDRVQEYEQSKGIYQAFFDTLAAQNYSPAYMNDYSYVLICYGIHLQGREKYDAAIAKFREILQMGIKQDDTHMQMMGIINMGWAYAENNQLDSAKHYSSLGLDAMSTYGDDYGQQVCHKALGFSYLKEGKLRLAEQHLLASDSLAKVIDLWSEREESTKFLSKLYQLKELPEKAYYYTRQNKIVRDSVFNMTKSNQLALLQTQFGIAERERVNELLENKLANRAQLSSYLTIGVVLAILAAILGISLAQQRQRNNEKLEVTVTERTQDLQLANQELKEFAYITSHDMRAPIRSIHSFSQLAERRLFDERFEDVKDYLDIIGKSSMQLNSLVTDVYNFVKIDDFSLNKTRFNFHHLLNEVTTDLVLQIKEKEVIVDFGPTLDLTINYSLLKIVLKNLVENGIKYNESKPVKIQLQCIETVAQYQFMVADNGIGIDKQYKDYIFKMFKRLHHHDKYTGSGLGLSICKKIVEQLGGSIRLGDIGLDDRGTSFIITIPK